MNLTRKPPASSSPKTPSATEVADKNVARKQPQVESQVADDMIHKIDRPGFDLGGSSGDTHAGTGLGLGDDASDTPGDRQLPGRRLDNNLTIPRWGGLAPRSKAEPAEKRSDRKTQSVPPTKNGR